MKNSKRLPVIYAGVDHIAPTRPRWMDWKCVACRAVFRGPVDRAPAKGCAACGSRQVFDVNVRRLSVEEWRRVGRLPGCN